LCDAPFEGDRVVVGRMSRKCRCVRVVAVRGMEMRERSCRMVRIVSVEVEERGLHERPHQPRNAQNGAANPHDCPIQFSTNRWKTWVCRCGSKDPSLARKAKFYAITPPGRKQLLAETNYWQRVSGVVGRVLGMAR